MPAAAVIPAPIAYIKVVAVKKLVVGFLAGRAGPPPFGGECRRVPSILPDCRVYRLLGRARTVWIIYCEKIRVFKAGFCYEYISME